MKKITLENYTQDKYYPRVVRAVHVLLQRGDVVAPIDLFIEMGLLDRKAAADWRAGRVPFLEKVIHGNLSAINRVLRILCRHAQDRGLRPSPTVYRRRSHRLRFSKSGEPLLEEAYGCHYLRGNSKKQKAALDSDAKGPASAKPPSEETGDSLANKA